MPSSPSWPLPMERPGLALRRPSRRDRPRPPRRRPSRVHPPPPRPRRPLRIDPPPPPAAPHRANVIVGGDRPVTVHVPPGYDPAKPAPLLLALHGYGSSGREEDAYLRLGKEAARRGYLYAYPDGTRDSHGREFWNATDACCDFDRSGVDDATPTCPASSARSRRSFAVDPKRIDLIGHSNGAFMSYAMACTHADQIAAIASLAGATYMHPADCAPTAPVAVLEIHGTADRTVAVQAAERSTSVRGGGRSRIPAQMRPSPIGRGTTAVRTPRSSMSMSTSTPTFGPRTGRPRPP